MFPPMPLADPILVLADETDDDDAIAQATRDLLALARRVGTPVLVRCDQCRAAAELINIAREHRPRAILINASPANDRTSAQVAVHLESAIITDVTDLSIESDHLIAVSDRMRSQIHTPTSVITVRPRIHEPQRELLLTEADVVVAGGRGVGSAEGFSLLARVAYALGGRLGGTHTAGELGWCPRHARISLPGAHISPRLYLAGGVSGSIRHRSAIRGARTVVAIDRDPNAPILREADFGIVGDLHEVLPALLEELAARAPAPPHDPTAATAPTPPRAPAPRTPAPPHATIVATAPAPSHSPTVATAPAPSHVPIATTAPGPPHAAAPRAAAPPHVPILATAPAPARALTATTASSSAPPCVPGSLRAPVAPALLRAPTAATAPPRPQSDPSVVPSPSSPELAEA
jgi:electron transfer flavoprotein alpha subunit